MEQLVNGKKRVAVLFGGQSSEHEVSLLSSINIIQEIDRQKYDLTLIGVDKQGRWMLFDEHNYLINADNPAAICLAPKSHFLAMVPGYNQTQFINVSTGKELPAIDVVFSVLHGACGEDGSVQGLLRVLNIPFVGPDVLGSAICMDKDMTKRVLRDAGVLVTPSITLLRNDLTVIDFDSIVALLGLPLFIKPANQGSSVGLSKVTGRTGFDQALMLAFKHNPKVLVEQAITGREIETAVLGNSDPEVSVCGEIFTNKEFYAYNTKYLKDSQARLIIPAQLDPSLAEKIRRTARQAYLALNCSVMARIDFFLTDDGRILLNEVNTLPGFTSISMYPKLWKSCNLDYPALMDRLIMLAMERSAHKTEQNQLP
ncbi:MAG: D-alanine--D-alanine ligase A [Sodalis sp. Fse]|nr:MAG: D-alanine--D-alanine ligase A [Sodalis sp. Fse]